MGATANEGKGWQPIGLYTPHGATCCSGLAGTFDGQGYEIRDLFINRPDEDSVGLFKYIDRYYGIIEDVGVTNVTVIGRDGVGGLVGGNGGTVTNCYCGGEVTGNASVGGLAGSGNGIVTGSYFIGSVTGYEYAGGLVGYNFCDVSESHFAGNVTGNSYVGGLLGANWRASVSDCYCSGMVSGHDHVGGLVGFVGWVSGVTVSDSYSTASVSGDEGVGGLVGGSYWEAYGLVEFDVSNSYYDYDEVLVNGKHIVTIGALSGEDFDQWLAKGKFLDINERLSQENGYYLIDDVNDFKQLLACGQDANLKFRLTSDLDLTTEPGFYIPYLAGEFDGSGHRISNLSFNSGFVRCVGLFGYLHRAGEVTQVGVENINITGASSVGGLVGQSWGTVSASYSSGTVTGSADTGGLVGGNGGNVSNSYSAASVSADSSVGGLVGCNKGTVSDCYSTGSVTGHEYVGSLVGWNWGPVSDSYAAGSVTGEDGIGGLVGVGLAGAGPASNSYYNYDEVLINGGKVISIGALSSEDFNQWLANDKFLDVNGRLSQEDGYYLINDVDDFKQLLAFGQNASLRFRLTSDLDLAAEPNFYIPYLAGEFDGNGHKISNLSFNLDFVSYVGLFGFVAPRGNVTRVGVENANVTGRAYVGGLVGFNGGNVYCSYSTGSVSGREDVGGLVGYNLGPLGNCHSAASVTGGQDVGGLVGKNDYALEVGDADGVISNSYSAGRVTGNDQVGGLVGYNLNTASNSFWDRQTSKRYISDGGMRKTTAQMKDIATFSGAGWNITTVASAGVRNLSYTWNIVDGATYPFLSWEPIS